MADDRIDNYVNRGAFSEDTQFVLGELNKVFLKFKELDGIKISMDRSAGLGEFAKLAQQASAGLTSLGVATKTLKEDSAKLVEQHKKNEDAQRKLDKAIAEGKLEKQKYNAELKKEIELQNASAGSIDQARALVKNLTAERNKLDITTDEGKKKLQQLNAEIDKNNAFIDENTDALSRRKINIGNYAGSAKIIVDALDKTKQKLAEVEQQFGTASPEAQQVRKEFEALQRITDNPKFLSIAARVGDTNKELSFFKQRLNELEDAGLKNSQVYNEVRARLAALSDQIGDTNAEIKAMASDTRQFDLFAGSVNFAADAFQTFAGAAVLAGASEEDAAAATKTLVAVQSVANGVKGIANELTTKGTAANILYAKVQAIVATATDTSAKATARLAAAGKLLAGGLLIAGIAYLIIKYNQLNKAITDTQRQAKLLSEVNKEVAKSAGSEIANLQALYKVATNTTISIKERKKAVKELQDQYPDYFKNIKDEIILQGKAKSAYDATKQAIVETAKTRAIENKLAELASKELEQLQKKEDINRDLRENQNRKKRADAIKASSKDEREARGLEQFAAIAEGSDLVKSLDDINKDLEEIGKDREFLLNNITTSGVKTSTDEKKAKAKSNSADIIKLEQDTRRALFAVSQQELQDQINVQNDIIANEEESYAERFIALKKFRKLSSDFISNQKDFGIKELQAQADAEIAELKRTAIENGLTKKQVADQEREIRENSLAKQKELEAKFNSEVIALDKQANDQRLQLRDQWQQNEADHRSSEHEATLQEIQNQYDEEILKLDKKFEKGRISEEKYNKKKLLLQTNLQIALLKEDIAFTKTSIELAEARAAASGKQEDIDAVAAAKKKFAALEIQLDQAVFEYQKSNRDKTLNDIEEVLAKVIEVAGQVEGIVGGILGAIADREKNRIQEQIDLLEEKKLKEIEVANSTIANVKDREAAIAIIEARTQAQREVLERKQRQADERRARFEKAASIARIIIETALAVVHQLGTGDPYTATGRAFAAGALGAAQLAVAIATPIPKFKDGKNASNKYEGLAIVGDGGKSELILREGGGKEVTPNTPTLTYVGKNDQVLPDANLALAMGLAATGRMHNNIMEGMAIAQSGHLIDYDRMDNSFSKVGRSIVKAIQNKKELHFKSSSVKDRMIQHYSNNKEYMKMHGIKGWD